MLMANKTQSLSEHLLNVASLSRKIIESFEINDNSGIDKNKIMKLAYLAGLFHDIGKIDPVFQSYLMDKTTTPFNPNGVHIEKKGFSFEEHPRHNEISWFILEELFDKKDFKLNTVYFRMLKNIVLWHHSAPIRKEEFTSSEIKTALRKKALEFKNNINNLMLSLKKESSEILDININDEDLNDLFESDNRHLVDYKAFFVERTERDLEQIHKDIRLEAISSLVRSVVITADGYVSARGGNYNEIEAIKDIFEENKYSELIASINEMEKSFYPSSERSKTQLTAAKKLSEISKNEEIAILNAPAGAGKTKVALQWIKEEGANKVYYIVPRTIIAEEIFDELKNTYIKKNVSFEIITGDKQIKWTGKKEIEMDDSNEYYKSDIVITTIDQLIKSTTTHKNISLLQDVMMSHVIFDEYHEYYKMSGIDLLFAEIIKIKSFFKKTKTMVMSATPNYFMLDSFLDIHDKHSKNMVSFETMNKKNYKMNYYIYEEGISVHSSLPLFNETDSYDYQLNPLLKNLEIKEDPFYRLWDDKKTIVISNTATMAQKSYILNNENENGLLAHSKLKQEDKLNTLKDIKSNFAKIEYGKDILRAGPIVQASLNITSERLITDLASPEDMIQRLGRLNRFANDFDGEFIIAIPLKALNQDIKMKSNVLNLLSKSDKKDSTILWLEFLMNKIKNKSLFKLDEIYSFYKEFYSLESTDNSLLVELEKSLSKSYNNIRKNILNPVDLIGVNKNKKEEKIFSKKSLRGKSYNTKMAIYEINDNILSISEEYVDEVSLSRELILMYDDNYQFVKETVKRQDILSDNVDSKVKSLLKKANRQKSDKYYSYVLDQSRKSSFNIYTSFSKKELEKLNKNKNIEDSYIYVKTKNQVIGYIKLKQLIK